MLAADAARVLDDRGIGSAHVVGLSMGAAVGLELAIRMPHRRSVHPRRSSPTDGAISTPSKMIGVPQ
jgi:pimeloyl-ACP methyl ester carboxylesterase